MKVYLDTIGCRLNQAEIETFARHFRLAGHEIVSAADQADLAVINTCTVTHHADSDSRQKLRQMACCGVGQIIATGCWATLHPEEAAGLPSITRVIPNERKDSLVHDLLQLPGVTFDHLLIGREPVPGPRLRTRAFIKVQDGCNNHCAYCITTLARGPARSLSLEAILVELQSAIGGGAMEAVLTGVHLGSWGQDFDPPQNLSRLVLTILSETELPRLRLSSLEPWDLDPQFFDLWADPRLCRQLHLPLQSGCAATLRRMARKTTPETYSNLVDAARAAIPSVAITTDIMVGFPGEDEAEFAESLAFVQTMQFAAGHVFSFSERPGTIAAGLPGQVPHSLRKERSTRMRQVLAESTTAFRTQFVGCTMPVLWEKGLFLALDHWQLSGLTDNHLRVTAHSPNRLWNQITPVKITCLGEDSMQGHLMCPQPLVELTCDIDNNNHGI